MPVTERTMTCLREHRAAWRVVHRHGNRSAFNGYRWTRSAFSCLRCGQCGRVWRTDAAYVDRIPDVDPCLPWNQDAARQES